MESSQETTSAAQAQQRTELACDAAAEMQAIANMLLRERDANPHSNDFRMIMRTTLRRVHDLASVVMSVTGGDDTRETSEMYEVVHLAPMEIAA